VAERYRLLDYEGAKEGLERDAKENQHPPVGIDRNYRGKHLQLHFTVEDPGVFTMPWTATITYGRGLELTLRRQSQLSTSFSDATCWPDAGVTTAANVANNSKCGCTFMSV
jgi:hypothetical protein